jgi:cell division protein ZapA
VDRRVASVKSMGGQFGENRLLLLAALLLADEVHDLRIEVSQARAGMPSAPAPDPRLAHRLSQVAERIERIAAGLEAGG